MLSVRAGRALSKTALTDSEIDVILSCTSMSQTPSSVKAESEEMMNGRAVRAGLIPLLSPEKDGISSKWEEPE